MHIAVISDIHGNLEALEAVLADIDRFKLDGIWCLGDVIGYGPDPLPCLDLVYAQCQICLAGNHDYAGIDKIDTSMFNPYARASAAWTKEQLRPEDLGFLPSMPLVVVGSELTAVHASLDKPEEFHYVTGMSAAEKCFELLSTDILLIGHTHLPICFLDTKPMSYTMDDVVFLEKGARALVNVGSVGQSREEDKRACYVIIDTERRLIRYRRVEYDKVTHDRKLQQLFPDFTKFQDDALPGMKDPGPAAEMADMNPKPTHPAPPKTTPNTTPTPRPSPAVHPTRPLAPTVLGRPVPTQLQRAVAQPTPPPASGTPAAGTPASGGPNSGPGAGPAKAKTEVLPGQSDITKRIDVNE